MVLKVFYQCVLRCQNNIQLELSGVCVCVKTFIATKVQIQCLDKFKIKVLEGSLF